MPNEIIDMNSSGSRITQIGFIMQNNDSVGIAVRGIDWRIDHCRFENSITPTNPGVHAYAYSYEEHPVGVVDHCEFFESRVIVYGSMALLANNRWFEPLGLGTNNAVFVEDCVFTRTHGNAIDANYGGKYIFRYNTVNDAYIEAHAVQGNNRSARSWEIYNNTINQVNYPMWVPIFLRGGTGVVFNNTIIGNWQNLGIAIDYRRAFESFPVCGMADGSNPWDGNIEPSGWPGRDQIGRSTDQWLWTDANPYPTQTLDPAYCWNNIYQSGNVEFFVHNNCENFLQEGRDFYNNQIKPGYTPYTYPHPLVTD